MEISEYRNMYNLEKYHWWFVVRFKLVTDNIPSIGTNLKLLDVGCGTGLVVKNLIKKGYDAYGIDIIDESLKFCKFQGLKKVIKGDILHLPFEDNSFDVVTCLDILYHQEIKDDVLAMNELFRVLKLGGRLVITSCANKSLSGRHDKLVHTRERYELEEICNKLNKCGFDIKKASYFHMFLFPIVYIYRKIDNYINKDKPIKSDVKKMNPIINFLLKSIFFTEVIMLKKINLPFGVSLFCVAEKPSIK